MGGGRDGGREGWRGERWRDRDRGENRAIPQLVNLSLW